MRPPRPNLDNLNVYHLALDSPIVIDYLKSLKNGNLSQVKHYVNIDNVNSSIGYRGYYALELAIIFDHKHIFDYLVYELGANINIKNKQLDTMPFVALAFHRKNYLFELLNLDTNSLYECKNGSQRTLMHQAAICGDNETVYRLLNEFGFYKNLNEFELGHLLYDRYSCSALYYACWFGFIDIVEQLLNCSEETLPSISARLNSSLSITNEADEQLDDDVFSSDENESSKNIVSYVNTNEKCIVNFEDSSLAISILYKRFDCVKLLITRSIKSAFFRMKNSESSPKLRANENNSTELDCWFAASMKLESLNDYMNMRDIFHELVLNGCKFSNYLFSLFDSMNDLKQFRFDNSTLQERSTFNYNAYMSYFLKCLAFICNYNLEKLFNNVNQCELFLKSCFVKINELLLTNDLIFYTDINYHHQFETKTENVNIFNNRTNIEWFKFDLKQLMNSLYKNNLSFKYFSNKKFFNFLKKKPSIYNLIESNLYSYASSTTNNHQLIAQVQPLKLTDLSKIKIKSTLRYLDNNLINTLALPKQLNAFVSLELSNGLEKSYERAKMNKIFKLSSKF